MKPHWMTLTVVAAALTVASCADGFESSRVVDFPGYSYLKVTRCVYARGPSHDLVLVETDGGWYRRLSLLFVKGEPANVFLARVPHERSGAVRCGREAVCLGSLAAPVRFVPFGGVVVGDSFPARVRLDLQRHRHGLECAAPVLEVTVKCRPKEDRDWLRGWLNENSAGLGAMREGVLEGTGF